jgi:hypothetical protein
MNILPRKKALIDLLISYFVVLIATWIIVMTGIAFFKDIPPNSLGGILEVEGFDFAIAIYSFFAIFLIPIIYLYSCLDKRLLTNKAVLFITALFSQAVLWLEAEGIVKYTLIPPLTNTYANLFVLYFITVGAIVLLLQLFKNKDEQLQ